MECAGYGTVATCTAGPCLRAIVAGRRCRRDRHGAHARYHPLRVQGEAPFSCALLMGTDELARAYRTRL